MPAPSTMAASLAQAMLGGTRRMPHCRAKATVGAGDDPVGSDDVDEVEQPFGDQLRVLDEIGDGVDHAGDERHVVRYGDALEDLPLVRVARVGGLERDAAHRHRQDHVDDVAERNVVVVRAFKITPAQVQPQLVGRQARQHFGQHVQVHAGGVDELRIAEVAEARVARHRQVRTVDLQDVAGVDDGAVLVEHRLGEGFEVLPLGGVVDRRHERVDHAR